RTDIVPRPSPVAWPASWLRLNLALGTGRLQVVRTRHIAKLFPRRLLAEVNLRRSTEERLQDCFLRVHAVFGLIEDHGLRSVENFRGDFRAAVRRKTVQERCIGRSK